MKKIGFIDYYIDEFHSHTYARLINEGPFADRMRVAYAYEKQNSGGQSLEDWCKQYGAAPLESLEEVVDKSDYLVILSPDNSERHEELSRYALKTGKPTFVDKTFAPDVQTAERMFQLADEHGTPVFSTSALRYSEELNRFRRDALGDSSVRFVSTRGPSSWERYAVHQVEMVVVMLGIGAKRVMQISSLPTVALAIDYADGRSAIVNAIDASTVINDVPYEQGFEINMQFGDGAVSLQIRDGNVFYTNLIETMCSFFETRVVPVPHEETIEVMKILDAGKIAIESPKEWIEV